MQVVILGRFREVRQFDPTALPETEPLNIKME